MVTLHGLQSTLSSPGRVRRRVFAPTPAGGEGDVLPRGVSAPPSLQMCCHVDGAGVSDSLLSVFPFAPHLLPCQPDRSSRVLPVIVFGRHARSLKKIFGRFGKQNYRCKALRQARYFRTSRAVGSGALVASYALHGCRLSEYTRATCCLGRMM